MLVVVFFFMSSYLLAVFFDWFLHHFWGAYAIESVIDDSKLHFSSLHRAMWAPPPTWTFSEASMP